jgi:hypothetical protein
VTTITDARFDVVEAAMRRCVDGAVLALVEDGRIDQGLGAVLMTQRYMAFWNPYGFAFMRRVCAAA